jgi:phenylalanyl-tRNA synthetase beta chain
MRVPLSWLKDFTPIALGADELADVMNALGLVVDGIERIGDGLDGVVIGYVLDVRQHPNADRVRLADIDLGDGQPLQIACGGANLAKGQTVPVATIGATLPNGMTIERRKLRGEWSNGMICSEDELGLAAERSGGIMVLPDGLPLGAPFAATMGIEKDVVFDLEIETNRPDAMCVAGVARDLAGKLGLPFVIPQPPTVANGDDIGRFLSVDVQDRDLCPRFSARVLPQVRVGPSPKLIARRLELSGMRPINNVVDASNYVMLELGQPSHPFDLAKVPGGKLGVRSAREGETITTLDGSERKLPAGSGVIVDGSDSITGIAAIMGGESSEIDERTTSVVLEAAVWNPYRINFTSRKLALRTDASARFERRIDREQTVRALDRIIEILQQSDPELVVAAGVIDDSVLPAWPADSDKIRVRTDRVNAILGTQLTDEEVAARLSPIGFRATLVEPGVHEVVIPSFRPDNEREIDVIEEVARMHGYDNIARRVPTAPVAARLTPQQLQRRQLRSFLSGRGYTEAWTAALIGPEDLSRSSQSARPIVLTNPVVGEESLLRPSLLPGMLRAIAYNTARQNLTLQLFEIGHVFNQPLAGETLPDEKERVAIASLSPTTDARSAAALWRDLSLTLRVSGVELRASEAPGLHATRTSALLVAGREVGFLGEVDPSVLAGYGIDGRVAWLELETAALFAQIETTPQMQSISRFPSSEFDLAFVVPDDVPASAVEATVRSEAGMLLEQLTLFDVFRSAQLGEGKRSLAYRLRVASLEGTMNDTQTGELRRKVVEAVELAHRASLRA